MKATEQPNPSLQDAVILEAGIAKTSAGRLPDEADAIEARAKATGKNPVDVARDFILHGDW